MTGAYDCIAHVSGLGRWPGPLACWPRRSGWRLL